MALLWPASVLICGVALCSLNWRDVVANKSLFWFWSLAAAIVIFQILPLPVYMQSVRGNAVLFKTINVLSGSCCDWRPISTMPFLTINTLFSMAAPIAVFLVGIQLVLSEIERIFLVVLLLGISSAILGILQIVGDPHGAMYTYSVTNNGLPVGVFANRNHQAVFLASLLPLIAIFAVDKKQDIVSSKIKKSVGFMLAMALIILILITGSRAGLFALTIGISVSLSIISKYQPEIIKTKNFIYKPIFIYSTALICVFILVAITIFMSRAEGISRLTESSAFGDIRFRLWLPTIKIAIDMSPIGSGAGTFVPLYQVVEPKYLLTHYLINQSHNDLLDLYLTLGWSGIILFSLFITIVIQKFYRTVYRSRITGRFSGLSFAAMFILTVFAFASFFDYPLRTPILSCYVTICIVWLSKFERPPGKRLALSEAAV